MKKTLSILLAVLMLLSVFFVPGVSAEAVQSAPTGFETWNALFAHAVSGSDDGDAWVAWQSEHDEDFFVADSSVKYFFLPSSANEEKVDVYNAFSGAVTVNGTEIGAGQTGEVSFETDTDYPVVAGGKTYTLRFMRSGAEAAIYINNSDADGEGTDLMTYLNFDKSRSAKATGAIVTPDGKIDNTVIKKIKGRGNTTWGKPKKAYNITYDSKVSIAGMSKSKKYSILANYQDDSLSRNRFLYDLSDAVGMPYASDSRYVDFYVNGFYWGSYQMTEKVEAGSSSLVSDFEEEDYLSEDGQSVNEDFPFVAEVDAGAKDGEDYYVSISGGIKVTIKAPELGPDDVGYDEVKQYVKDKFTAFYTAAATRTKDLSDYADVDSLATLYLINELGKNWDSGVSSTFFTYKPDEDGVYKFYGSPVWDYDNSLGNAVGVKYELSDAGVNDYEEYTGWWCKYKGKNSRTKTSSNIMNRLSVNKSVTEAAETIWNERFIPAINHFAGTAVDDGIDEELYTADMYYSLIRDSAAMNYTSGWLLNTGSWIADHSSLTTATYDAERNVYSINKYPTSYDDDFEGMYNYCRDWMISRAAWLSKEMAEETPTIEEVDNKVEEPTEEETDNTTEPTESTEETEPTESTEGGTNSTVEPTEGATGATDNKATEPEKPAPSVTDNTPLGKYKQFLAKNWKGKNPDDFEVDVFKKLKSGLYLVHYAPQVSLDVMIYDYIDKYLYISPGSAAQVSIFDSNKVKTYALAKAFKKGIITKKHLKTISKTLDKVDNVAKLKENIVVLNPGRTYSDFINGKGVKVTSSKPKVVKVVKEKNGKKKLIVKKKGTAKITVKKKNGTKYIFKIVAKRDPEFADMAGNTIKSVTVKEGGKVKLQIVGKVKGIDNIYRDTKYAKITSKKTAKTITIKGLKKGKTTLRIYVNGKELTLKVKVK